jgi:hypothetical protein
MRFMRTTFTHKRIRTFIEQNGEESYLFGFTLRGQEVRGTAKTRLAGMARKRAQIMLDRKLREVRSAEKQRRT